MEELTNKIVSAIYRSKEFHNVVDSADNYNKLEDIIDRVIQDHNKELEYRKALNTFIKNNF